MVWNSCVRDGRRVAARVTSICILANLALAGCAVSPADDRRQLTPTKLRDGGRGGDYDDDDEETPTARGRDAGNDARVSGASAPADSGRAQPTPVRDAGTRTGGAPDAGAPAPPAQAPAVVQSPQEPSTSVNTSVTPTASSDSGAGRTRGSWRDDDDEEEDEEEEDDERPSRLRDAGAAMMPSAPAPQGPGPGAPGGRFICWTGRQCQPTACKPTEEPCCRSLDTTCGCKDRFSLGLVCR